MYQFHLRDKVLFDQAVSVEVYDATVGDQQNLDVFGSESLRGSPLSPSTIHTVPWRRCVQVLADVL